MIVFAITIQMTIHHFLVENPIKVQIGQQKRIRE